MKGFKDLTPEREKRWNFHPEETYKSLITISVEALKMVALINGGAAVAILAYLGNLASHPSHRRIPNMTCALAFFSIGLLLTVLAFIASYLTQLRLYNEERIQDGLIDSQRPQAILTLSNPKNPQWLRLKARFLLLTHEDYLTLAFVLIFLATVAFGIGCVVAAFKFTKV